MILKFEKVPIVGPRRKSPRAFTQEHSLSEKSLPDDIRKAFCFMVEPMGGMSNFDPEDLIKIFEFLEIVEPNVEL